MEEKKDKIKLNIWQKLFKKDIVKKGKTAVLYLRNNGIAEPMEVESKKGFFNIKGKTYHEDRDCTYTITKDRIPLAIIPEWSMIPYGLKKWHDKSLIEKFSELEDHLLRGIRHAELVKMGDKENIKLNTKAMVVIGIIVIIGIAFLVG